MIPCPDCGQEISDKAKKCIHCGKVLIEEVKPKKFCAECGKEIDIAAEECPFCGCPVEPEKNEPPAVAEISKTVKKNKKPIIIAAAIVAVILVVVLIANAAGSTLNEHEQLAYQNAMEMKSMMRDPDSFKLYDQMFLIEKVDDEGNVEYTYTIFKYGGANGYGAITTDQAIFRDGEYIMDYADEPDKDDSDYLDKLKVKAELAMYSLGSDNFRTVDIDIEKIKDKMGLE